jgi:hypothetical protein
VYGLDIKLLTSNYGLAVRQRSSTMKVMLVVLKIRLLKILEESTVTYLCV